MKISIVEMHLPVRLLADIPCGQPFMFPEESLEAGTTNLFIAVDHPVKGMRRCWQAAGSCLGLWLASRRVIPVAIEEVLIRKI